MTKSILFPIDLNQESSWSKALPLAVKLAAAENAELNVFTAIPDYGMSLVGSFFPPDYAKNTLADTQAALDAFVAEHLSGDVVVKTRVRHGTIYKEILKAADKLGCDLIVLASHRPETKDYLLGPNAARVVRHASQSVYVVRE